MKDAIYIPTYKRSDNQRTWPRLTPKLQRITKLAVDYEERDLYRGYPLLVLPPEVKGIAATREFILLKTNHERVVMLDDDLQFYYRPYLDDWHLKDITPEELDRMFDQLFGDLCGDYAHLGVSSREGNNRILSSYLENTRAIRLLGYHLPTVRAIAKFPLGKCMEDFDLTLQLLLAGHPNVVYFNWAQGQKLSNAKGGCSTYRTIQYHGEAARTLAEKYPEYVTLVTKKTKTAWGGGERTDVRVSWKKAYEDGKRQTRLLGVR